jgi:hypothetical protein
MKLVLKYLLQLPLLYFLFVGIHSIDGDNFWISLLVGISVLFLYTTGDYLETDE